MGECNRQALAVGGCWPPAPHQSCLSGRPALCGCNTGHAQRNMVFIIQEIHFNQSEKYISQNLRNNICPSVASSQDGLLYKSVLLRGMK